MADLTEREAAIIGLVRANDAAPRTEIRKRFSVGRLEIVFSWRSSKNLWGRFGGGWNWVLGVQVGSSTVIVNLLICSLRFSRRVRP